MEPERGYAGKGSWTQRNGGKSNRLGVWRLLLIHHLTLRVMVFSGYCQLRSSFPSFSFFLFYLQHFEQVIPNVIRIHTCPAAASGWDKLSFPIKAVLSLSESLPWSISAHV